VLLLIVEAKRLVQSQRRKTSVFHGGIPILQSMMSNGFPGNDSRIDEVESYEDSSLTCKKIL
jgi:hypothetical protein